MVMCFVPLCKHYSEQKTCRFLTFPVNPEDRKKWVHLIRRADREPSKYSLVCSCHFKHGERKNGPTLFEHNFKRRLEFSSPEKRERTRKQGQKIVSAEREGMPEQDPMPGTSQTVESCYKF
ncbi:hypothetical protein RN001_001341 [Aquatica leii]|uniref:THAP-type domain-containing protein n=1 Tax=Aquatica leii TaxID=1421715 RepID=A0AAN7PBG1_9COLE|nr:hypothetical protein RN001_001341 [Aquatica leii]